MAGKFYYVASQSIAMVSIVSLVLFYMNSASETFASFSFGLLLGVLQGVLGEMSSESAINEIRAEISKSIAMAEQVMEEIEKSDL